MSLQPRDKNGKFLPPLKWYRDLKIGVFDLESTGFTGNNDYIICWAVKPFGVNNVRTDHITKNEVWRGTYDKRIIGTLYDELNLYDVIMTYNGIIFDAKMFKTRCLHHGLKPFYVREKYHLDVYWKVKSLLNLSRCSLKMACKFFGIKGKTDLDFDYWQRSKLGDPVAMEKLLVHNRNDVIILERLFNKIEPYVKYDRKGF